MENFVFDPEVALKAATSAVVGLSSAWNRYIQDADRKEVIAQAVAKAWNRRNSFDPRKASFRTWGGRIARNCLLDHYRKTGGKEDGGFGVRQETARVLDCTPNAASIRCFRARKALREKLADLL